MQLPRHGSIPLLACPGDPRFSYFSWVPVTPARHTVVVVHGSDRRAETMRDAVVGWAHRHDCAVVAPLFPAGLLSTGDVDDYKYARTAFADYTAVLLDAVDDVAGRFGAPSAFSLIGFSGGAQFALRLALLQPQRVRALSVCAPGNVTVVDSTRPWWVGTADPPGGQVLDLAALRAVPVQTVVGADDLDTELITMPTDSPYWQPGANDAGRTRVERLGRLGDNLAAHGVRVRRDVLPGVCHEFAPMIPAVTEFLDECVQDQGGG